MMLQICLQVQKKQYENKCLLRKKMFRHIFTIYSMTLLFFKCLIFNRRAYRLLWLFCSSDGHRTEYPRSCLSEQLRDNHTGQLKSSVQVRLEWAPMITVQYLHCVCVVNSGAIIFLQGLHCVMFRGHCHRQRESRVALLFSLWSKRYSGKIYTLFIHDNLMCNAELIVLCVCVCVCVFSRRSLGLLVWQGCHVL